MDPVSGYQKKDGTRVRRYRRRRRASTAGNTQSERPRGQARTRGITVAVTISGGIAAITLYSTSSGASSPKVENNPPSSSKPSAELSVDLQRTKAALLVEGYKSSFYVSSGTNCAAHSYGQVHAFFKSHPCKLLARAYLAVRRSNSDTILVAISWVEMSNASTATTYQNLVDQDGTGNITELSRDSGQYRNVIFNGNLYASGMNGSTVWNAQVQPVNPTPPTVLNEILKDSRQ